GRTDRPGAGHTPGTYDRNPFRMLQAGRPDAGVGQRGGCDQALGRTDRPGAGHPPGTHGSRLLRGLQPRWQDPRFGQPVPGPDEIKEWDARSGQDRATRKGHTDGVGSVAFSPDSKTLASASDDGTIKLWDARSGQERATLKGHEGGVTVVVPSPDGRTLASGS